MIYALHIYLSFKFKRGNLSYLYIHAIFFISINLIFFILFFPLFQSEKPAFDRSWMDHTKEYVDPMDKPLIGRPMRHVKPQPNPKQ